MQPWDRMFERWKKASGWGKFLWVMRILLVTLLCLFAYRGIQGWLLSGRQNRTHVICQTYADYLARYQRAHGSYPPSLSDAIPGHQSGASPPVDAWGNTLVYQSDGRNFVLASLGRDGSPDLANDTRLLLYDTGPSPHTDICGFWDLDEVVSGQGFWTLCEE